MKKYLSSWTIQGAAAAILMRVFGIGEISGQEAVGILEQAKEMWPLLVGIGADVATKVSRVKETGIDKSFYKKDTFWYAVGAVVATLLPADLDIQTTIEKIQTSLPEVLLLVANAWQLIGAARSNSKIK